MDIHSTIITSNQVSVNGLVYSYSIKPFEITNALGTAVTTVMEYHLSGSAGDTVLLYKATEGNWYDMKQPASPFINALMQALKSAIDTLENIEGI